MFKAQIAGAILGAPTHAALQALSRAVWQGNVAGAVTDDEAQALAELIEARKAVWQTPARPALALSSPPSLFARARLQRPPDRQKALERRRRLATSGPLPPQLACRFTTGELAVLRIVGDECREHGACRRTYAEIAARAGVGRTTAQNAMRLAYKLGLLSIEERRRPGRKNLPNVVKILSREWQSWIARRSEAKGGGFKNPGTTDTGGLKQAPKIGAGSHNGARSPWEGPGRAWREGG